MIKSFKGDIELIWNWVLLNSSSSRMGLVLMGEIKVNKMRMHNQQKGADKPSDRIGQILPSFVAQLREKLQKSLESHLKIPMRNGVKSATSIVGKDKGADLDVSLEKQLQAWKENPTWVDQSPSVKVHQSNGLAGNTVGAMFGIWAWSRSCPILQKIMYLLQVTVPKGSLCNLDVAVNVGLPPDAVYNIVTDPDNKRVFKNIQEVVSRRVLVDEGLRQVVELEQAALWRFLFWSGTIAVHVLVDQNREDRTMRFKQVKTGFMKRFEGCWRVEPLFVDEKTCHPFMPKTFADYVECTGGKGRVGSRVSLEQIIQPALVPPPPISWYLRGITSKTTEMLINDLLAEAARIRGSSDSKSTTGETTKVESDEFQMDQMLDIKKRWALRRKNAKQSRRRSPPLVKSPTCD
ncbi:hypothetical protein RHGRI_034382 [Rhododendron griersonianum]|uniref:DUF220 domain-containing protein n=1 Tax=Rhododendron griersonianum TaxID=479676 RepID=A0AAV6I0D8_9ERIC|nr:hypothetical protein RHGRI_034382 [Rhododendron griersonianum]